MKFSMKVDYSKKLGVKYCKVKVNMKLSLRFNWALHHEGVLGGVELYLHAFLTSALDGGEWSASRPHCFTPRERAPGPQSRSGRCGGEKKSQLLPFIIQYEQTWLRCEPLIDFA
jgi:hypothetical protein